MVIKYTVYNKLYIKTVTFFTCKSNINGKSIHKALTIYLIHPVDTIIVNNSFGVVFADVFVRNIDSPRCLLDLSLATKTTLDVITENY